MALHDLEELGARAAALIVARRLREQGIRGVPRGPRPTTRDLPWGLTTREADILRLVAAGLRNAEIGERLFISVRTVEHHVSVIFDKVGVHSRVEAAREATRVGVVLHEGAASAPK
jgi:DNA-binding NarL/FixJ family response regulator